MDTERNPAQPNEAEPLPAAAAHTIPTFDDVIASVSPETRCPRCETDISRLPITARFCGRCGQLLSMQPADLIAPPKPVPVLPIPRPTEPRRETSLLVVGFSNALFRLGWRYETALGRDRNPSEAVRCYDKSARLGNAAAAARLGRR